MTVTGLAGKARDARPASLRSAACPHLPPRPAATASDRDAAYTGAALIYQHATRDRDQAIAMTLGDLARQVRRATDDQIEEPHEKA